MRELTADLFISLDGFASGVNEPPFFGYFGEDLSAWIKDNLEKPQMLIMGGVGAICNCLHRRVEHANDRAAKNRILKNPSRTASVEKHTFGSDPR